MSGVGSIPRPLGRAPRIQLFATVVTVWSLPERKVESTGTGLVSSGVGRDRGGRSSQQGMDRALVPTRMRYADLAGPLFFDPCAQYRGGFRYGPR